MGKLVDMAGQRFGRLIVLERKENTRHKKATWFCRCGCGQEKQVIGGDLQSGKTRSCGCLQQESRASHPPPPTPLVPMIGRRFGRLRAIMEMRRQKGVIYWLCQCDCGGASIVGGPSLRRGYTKSCGCYKDHFIKQIKDIGAQRFGRLITINMVGCENGTAMWLCKCDCGEQLKVRAVGLRSGHTQSCGCLLIDIKREAMTGANNPGWKGGVDDTARQIRCSHEYVRWKLSVWRRDEKSCQKCHQAKNRMVAHHMMGFAEYPDGRFDVDNGVTFCRDCHLEYHKLYGFRNSTREKTIEFLNNNLPLIKAAS